MEAYTRLEMHIKEVLQPVRKKGQRVCFGTRNVSSSSDMARRRILDSRLARGMNPHSEPNSHELQTSIYKDNPSF